MCRTVSDLNEVQDAITGTPAREQHWTLEVIGNWDAIVSKTNRVDDTPYDTRTHNTVNEITALDPQGGVGSFNLDWGEGASKSGNLYILPDRTDPTNKADRFHYDYRNRLIKVEHSDDYGEGTPAWSTVVEYYYDGLNRRVKKDLATGTDVIYLYDAWQVLEEREWDTIGEGAEDDQWEPRRQDVYGGIYIDEVLIFDKDTDDDGYCTDGGGSSRHFYCQQANWNVIAVTDSSGDTDEKIKYDSYGEATVTVQGGHSATGNPYLFQGRRWDSEVDLYYFRNRVYTPVLGRFLQRDPIGWAQALSLYEYVDGCPTYYSDPFGWEPFWRKTWRGAQRAGRGAKWAWRQGRALDRRIGRRIDLELAKLADPIFAGRLPGRATWQEVGAGYSGFISYYGGWDIQLEGGITLPFLSDGGRWSSKIIKMYCCDENNCRHRVNLQKTCQGVAAGIVWSAHPLGNITGKNCPKAYKGFFFEWSAGLGFAGVSGFIGIFTPAEERVTGGGGYVGVSLPVGLLVCKYEIMDDDIIGTCDAQE